MFNKQKYYKYIKDIQFQIGFIYSLYSILFFIIAIGVSQSSHSILLGILTFVFGICCASIHTKSLEIKVQEMHLNLLIYDKIRQKAD